MRRTFSLHRAIMFCVGLGGPACSGGGAAVPPPSEAPTQVAACLTFILEDAPPAKADRYDLEVIAALRKAVTTELVAAGFAIVESRDKPFDVILKLTATPGSRIESNAQLRGKLAVEGASGPIDAVEAASPAEAAGAADAVAAALVDGLFRSGGLGGYIKQLRRPGSTGLARTSLRNMTPACEGFVVPSASPSTAPSAEPIATAAPALSATPSPPPAPELLAGAAQPDSFAIVFGVEQYKSAPAAQGARGDAERFVRLATRTLGVPEAHVKTAFDQKADRLAVDLNIEWLKLNVPKGGRVYFYFAGNGTGGKAPGAPALVPYDGDAKSGAKTVPITSLLQALSETKAGDTFVIADASFGGTGARSAAAGDGSLFSIRGTSPVVRTAFLSAVTGTEGARLMPGGGGVLTHYLLEGIGRGRADENADGRVTLQEAFAWVGPRVLRAAKRDARTQTPLLSLGPALLPVDKLYLATGLDTP